MVRLTHQGVTREVPDERWLEEANALVRELGNWVHGVSTIERVDDREFVLDPWGGLGYYRSRAEEK
jgi:hypothetical protein